MRMNKGLGLAVLLALAAGSGGAAAAPIGGSQITASTSLGQYLYFSIDQITDGNLGDASPFNGYASGFGVVSGRITLTLDQTYDLSSFLLWNDVNISAEGVRSFTLTFEDAAGGVLGTTGTYTAVSQFAAQDYLFPGVVQGVKRVQLDVLTSSLQIEIREVGFNGEASVHGVPEPAGIALAAVGLAGIGVTRRRR